MREIRLEGSPTKYKILLCDRCGNEYINLRGLATHLSKIHKVRSRWYEATTKLKEIRKRIQETKLVKEDSLGELNK